MKELIEKLEALGFTNYESKVFLALFKGFNMTAAEIAEDAKYRELLLMIFLRLLQRKEFATRSRPQPS